MHDNDVLLVRFSRPQGGGSSVEYRDRQVLFLFYINSASCGYISLAAVSIMRLTKPLALCEQASVKQDTYMHLHVLSMYLGICTLLQYQDHSQPHGSLDAEHYEPSAVVSQCY